MSWRFRRRLRLHRWVWLNLAQRSVSLTVGRAGLCLNLSRRGVQLTLGLPGSGVHYQWRCRWPWGHTKGSG